MTTGEDKSVIEDGNRVTTPPSPQETVATDNHEINNIVDTNNNINNNNSNNNNNNNASNTATETRRENGNAISNDLLQKETEEHANLANENRNGIVQTTSLSTNSNHNNQLQSASSNFIIPLQLQSEVAPDADVLECVEWLKKRIVLKGYRTSLTVTIISNSDSLWKPHNQTSVIDFFTNNNLRRLILYMDPVAGLITQFNLPTEPVGDIFYFVKEQGKQVGIENIDFSLFYGVIDTTQPLDSMLRVMSTVFTPILTQNKTWPDSFSKEFTAQLHKFMASLTETTYHTHGCTVLYVPNEKIPSIIEAAADKELVQRLESALIHWTRQIKEVVNNQDNLEFTDNASPLAEIEFWRSRTVDLSGIRDQLERPGVKENVAVLEHAKSSYLKPFMKLFNSIQSRTVEAQDNLKFLSFLQSPCEKLASAKPKEIVSILPSILNVIRVIGNISQYYNTSERLTGLFRKVSNEIIARCCAVISPSEIFDGNVDDSIAALEDSIAAGEAWKSCYRKTAAAMTASALQKNEKKLEFDDSSIFAQIEAFVQRCRDLLEVCEGQIQFARKKQNEKIPFPIFSGTKAPEIGKSLADIETAFQRHINTLKSLDYSILDVKATRWHDDYNALKHGIKDLEVMLQNVITAAFDSVQDIEASVNLLEIFENLAKRDAIRRTVEKQTAHVHGLLLSDLNSVKKEFDQFKKQPPIQAHHPKFAGAAHWAKSLLNRIESHMLIIRNASHFLVQTREYDEAVIVYNQLTSALDEYMKKTFAEWIQSIDGGSFFTKRLENFLMARNHQGLLESGFDKGLLRLFVEACYWEKLKFDIPSAAIEVYSQQEKLRVIRENVLMLVKDYNTIMLSLNQEEKNLFADRILALDKKVVPGLQKYAWSSKNIETFVLECRKYCKDVSKLVADFKYAGQLIQSDCKSLSETSLVAIEKKAVYTMEQFDKHQQEYRIRAKSKLKTTHQNIRSIMKTSYEVFKNDSDDVQNQWLKYVQKIDKMVEDSLRATVKRSLLELARSINGDGKVEVSPLFLVNVVLNQQKVEFKPMMFQLQTSVTNVMKDITSSINVIPRLVDALNIEANEDAIVASLQADVVAVLDKNSSSVEANETLNGLSKDKIEKETDAAEIKAADVENDENEEKSKTTTAATTATAITTTTKVSSNRVSKNFYDVISNDDEIVKIPVNVLNGMEQNMERVHTYLQSWDKYKSVWDLDKDAYIKRYAKVNRTLAAFETDITRYKETQADVENEETIAIINFIRFDCSPLKHALVAHCVAWQNKFIKLLNSNAASELQTLTDYFLLNIKKVKVPPRNLDMLGESLGLLTKLNGELQGVESRFEPLNAQYQSLKNFEVAVVEEELTMLSMLQGHLTSFKESLVEGHHVVENSKEKFKSELMRSMEELSSAAIQFREDFQAKGPFESVVPINTANDMMNEFRNQLTKLRNKETGLKAGLSIFGIDPPVYKELNDTAKDIDLIASIWTCIAEWNTSWDSWKTTRFIDVNSEEMEEQALRFQKRVAKFSRESKQWEVLSSIKERIDQFKRMLPLIQDLKNKAFRQRHWDHLKEEVGKNFYQNGADFTLEKIFALGLDNYSETINTLSISASKELAIEEALSGIESTWSQTNFDLVKYKDQGHYRLKSADEVFQQLDDNQVTLSTMKASRYYMAFETQVEYWEKSLSHILETVEQLLAVQRQWIYLENIFAASDDIRRQLPMESTIFDNVNSTWLSVMTRLAQTSNVLQCCQREGIIDILLEMQTKLEKIQKSLYQYLETKRLAFPRFYFLSNEDLLEILGQSRDPLTVQPHLKKCFDAIKSLEFVLPGKDGRKSFEAVGMHSPDGEYVPFHLNVAAEHGVELWLQNIESMMKLTLKKQLLQAFLAIKKTKKEKWLKDWPGQILITSEQIQWTVDCTEALQEIEKGDRNAMRQLKKKMVGMLNKMTEIIRQPITLQLRLKLNALLTIDVHSRDVVERLIKLGTNSTYDFNWVSQLRFYYEKEKEEDECIVRQASTRFTLGYEYLGNSGRLVVTPLTDRCYITLTTALSLQRGGNPQGPAGTGKTETVKDLGKALMKYVVVFNCSEGLDYQSLGLMFSGFAQTGAWSCFDEFNRIETEVLSVVAQQILCILNAIRDKSTRFIFDGKEIPLNIQCGIFVTMNPTYSGRSELPDNLKALFRPVAMMVPNNELIAEIMLFSEGFSTAKVLSRKITTLYQLALQQLSKQHHYDFGLRSVKSILVTAGILKRADPDQPEDLTLLRALRDMNLPKLVAEDVPLFLAIMSDLFPSTEVPVISHGNLEEAIVTELTSNHLQPNRVIIGKAIQLYETKKTRHGLMLVGETGSGKTTTWMTLERALNRLSKENSNNPANAANNDFKPVKHYILNPKALSLGELYGAFDRNTNEWTDGILSGLIRTCSLDDKTDEKWIAMDGPVDTLWIESMNSVLDDSKLLTLVNGERISIPPPLKLVFEVNDLSQASPATVSRVGMIYMNAKDLGWEPYVQSWISKRTIDEEAEVLRRLFSKYIQQTLDFKAKNCTEIIPITPLNSIISLCDMYDALATAENGIVLGDNDFFVRLIELWFVFCLIWSIGAAIDEEGRKKFDMYLRELEAQFPAKDTVYDFFVDVKKKGWTLWEEKIPTSWKYPNDIPFYRILVPTADTVRYSYILNNCVRHKKNALLVGQTGTGKTSIIDNVLMSLDDSWTHLMVNVSAQTSVGGIQQAIESRIEKRTKDVYVPLGSKKMILFVDDLNMPAYDKFGSQPPLEFLRHWLEQSSWYDVPKQCAVHTRDVYMVAAMGPPGGGRNNISTRLLSKFHVINVTFPADGQLKRIYETMLNLNFGDFEEEIKNLVPSIVRGTIDLYQAMVANLLPTPQKSHYTFNLRDISKVIQGMLRAHHDFYDTKESIVKLWVHECYREFNDRLNDPADVHWFDGVMQEKVNSLFAIGWARLFKSATNKPIFCDFMREGLDFSVYEEVSDADALRKTTEDKLEDFNLEPGNSPMHLVLFQNAIEHVCRINRIIKRPKGNVLLVGVGGSGRQSLTKLAASIAEYKLFHVEISKNYRTQEFHEDLKKLFLMTGVEQKPTVFVFTDTQIVQESFLEDINNILSSGEVPNLFSKEELQQIFEQIRDGKDKSSNSSNNANSTAATTNSNATATATTTAGNANHDTAEGLYRSFLDRVKANLHVVLCFSPVGENFRKWLRQYPSLVNATTVDWVSEWPLDALREVGEKFLEDVPDIDEATKSNLSSLFGSIHVSVIDASKKMLFELRRTNYVTPTSYLDLVKGYKQILQNKRKALGEQVSKLNGGLRKLDETRVQVEAMRITLEDKKAVVSKSQRECEELLVVIVQERRAADEAARSVTAESEHIAEEEVKVKAIAEVAQAELATAMPALEAASQALLTLTKKDLAEVKAYAKPPPLVETVMSAVMILRKSEPTWAEAKRQLNDSNFLNQLIAYDKENIPDIILKRIEKITQDSQFSPEIVGKVSVAAKTFCMWVVAMLKYGHIHRDFAPKKKTADEALESLENHQLQLKASRQKLQEITDRVAQLKAQYDDSVSMKERLKNEAEETEVKLDRAEKLVEGLASERIRWEESIKTFNHSIGNLVGDCLMASAFVSYTGPFLASYRKQLVTSWNQEMKLNQIPFTAELEATSFLSKATEIRSWCLQGLPGDSFSAENGVIVTRSNRYPLMIDPQRQANMWIKSLEGEKGLKVIDLKQNDYMRTLENAIQFGTPVLLEDVGTVIDPSLDPILARTVIKQGGRSILRIGDKDIDYNPDFRFYITTQLSNPHYSPELCTKTTVVNFAIKEQGLEDQLLAVVVRREKPELEQQKDQLIVTMAEGSRRLEELEDEILRLLATSTGSLLDDNALVTALQSSKTTSEGIMTSMALSKQMEVKIDNAREAYRPCAQRASLLFFCLLEMSLIDHMYQFSLDRYIQLFNVSIEKATRSEDTSERIRLLNDYHTYAVYRQTCRGLMEKHKLLFSFQMVLKILLSQQKINMEELDFFLKGGQVLDRSQQLKNPAPDWLPEIAWDNLTELEKIPAFQNIASGFDTNSRQWKNWYRSAQPETIPLPGEWDNRCNELQTMIVLRCLRPDKVISTITSFISNNNQFGQKYVEPPPFDLNASFIDSSNRTPLLFILSPGADPANSLQQLAIKRGMGDKFKTLALGQGQAAMATKMIDTAVREGWWLFLANCHLSMTFMPALEKIIDNLPQPHPNFRLWLSSKPHPDFPISILQKSIKMTTEPPSGLKANLIRLYGTLSDDKFGRCSKPEKYKKLVFALSFFHSVLIERRKFGTLGWNTVYDFNESDFVVCENLLSSYLDEYDDVPWEALKYLIAEANYGGRVTEELDRRLLKVYSNYYFQNDALETGFRLVPTMGIYTIPEDGPLSSYRDYIASLPSYDKAEAFGQHPNADISAQVEESNNLLDTLISLQPRTVLVGGQTAESKVDMLASELLQHIPQELDLAELMGENGNGANSQTQQQQQQQQQQSPLTTVLLQEISRYNKLLNLVRNSLIQLQKGLKGQVLMSSELEQTFSYLSDNKVPPKWHSAYSSLKPLAAWARDLTSRIAMFATWAQKQQPPKVFNLSYFTYPTGFLTALLQMTARKTNVSVDSLTWDFSVLHQEEQDIQHPPKDGAYIGGIFLEGASWNTVHSCLEEPAPMQLIVQMPLIFFKVVSMESKKKSTGKGSYSCPLYIYPIRSGTNDRTSYVISVDLKCGKADADHYIKRQTALMLSTS